MARKVVSYYCEICNSKYPTEEEADKCQSRHCIPCEVKADFTPNDKKYPNEVIVYFKASHCKNGVRYYRCSK